MMKLLLTVVCLLTLSLPVHGAVSVDTARAIILDRPIVGNTVVPFTEAITKLVASSKDPIDIVLDSPGGSLIAGYLMVDQIEMAKKQGIKVRCFVRKLAASMAFQLLLSCDERYALPHSLVLWHPVRVNWNGPLTATDAVSTSKSLSLFDDMILTQILDELVSKPIVATEDFLIEHFNKETLHMAALLSEPLPLLFTEVSYDISNLFVDDGAAYVASSVGFSFFGSVESFMYIHEMFMPMIETNGGVK